MNKKGFSLVEIIMVMAVIGIVVAIVVVNFGQTRNQTLLEEGQASIINALEIARNRAASGVGDTNHGVRIEPDKVIVFEGDSYTGTGQETLLSPLSTDHIDSEITFERIRAIPNGPITINITHGSGLTESVTLNEKGVISSQ